MGVEKRDDNANEPWANNNREKYLQLLNIVPLKFQMRFINQLINKYKK